MTATVKQIVDANVIELDRKVDTMKQQLTAVYVLTDSCYADAMTQQDAFDIVTSKQFSETVPFDTPNKISFLKNQIELTETQIEALKSGAEEVYANGADVYLDDLKAELANLCGKIHSLNKFIEGAKDTPEASVAGVERYGLERRVLYLTLVKQVLLAR